MKTFSLLFLFVTLNLYAQKNWIIIEPITQTQNQPHKPKPTPKIDVNLSQIAPLNSMMRNVTLLQEIIKRGSQISKKRVATTDNKNWFTLESQTQK